MRSARLRLRRRRRSDAGGRVGSGVRSRGNRVCPIAAQAWGQVEKKVKSAERLIEKLGVAGVAGVVRCAFTFMCVLFY